jgi:hypothetical protein
MLARDPIEAAEQAQIFLKDKPLVTYYEDVLLEGLKLAQLDADRRLLDEERMQHIRDAVAELSTISTLMKTRLSQHPKSIRKPRYNRR